MLDGLVFGAQMAELVRGYVEVACAPLRAQIVELKAAQPLAREDVEGIVARAVQEAVSAIPVPADGKSVELADVAELVASEVAKIPAPKDGRDADPAEIERMVAEAVAAIPAPKDGEDGKSVDPDQVAAMFAEAISAVPLPQDGRSVSLEDVQPVIEEAVSRAVSGLPVAKDGVGLAGAIINRDGDLVVTLTNGETRELGPVVGKDAAPELIGEMVAKAVSEIPAPKDGVDGVGFEDLTVEFDGERTVSLAFTRGETVKAFDIALPIVLDRGVYREGGAFQKGDGVTWGGSFWIAQRDTGAKPETNADWRLAVKRGRDGKDAGK